MPPLSYYRDYIQNTVPSWFRGTRNPDESAEDFVNRYVDWGTRTGNLAAPPPEFEEPQPEPTPEPPPPSAPTNPISGAGGGLPPGSGGGRRVSTQGDPTRNNRGPTLVERPAPGPPDFRGGDKIAAAVGNLPVRPGDAGGGRGRGPGEGGRDPRMIGPPDEMPNPGMELPPGRGIGGIMQLLQGFEPGQMRDPEFRERMLERLGGGRRFDPRMIGSPAIPVGGGTWYHPGPVGPPDTPGGGPPPDINRIRARLGRPGWRGRTIGGPGGRPGGIGSGGPGGPIRHGDAGGGGRGPGGEGGRRRRSPGLGGGY